MDVKSLKRENVTTDTKWTDACARQASGCGARGVWRGRWSNQVKPSRTKSNQKLASRGEGARKSGHRSAKAGVSVQAYDFSPVMAFFHLISRVFTPFLSHKGLVSRRLGRISGIKDFGDGKQAQPAPLQVRNSECGADPSGRAISPRPKVQCPMSNVDEGRRAADNTR
jgi:hypothetical protein